MHRIKTPENTKAAATETTIFKRQKNYKKKGTAATLPKRENTHNYCYYSQNYHRTKKKRQFHRTTTNFRRDRRLGFFFFWAPIGIFCKTFSWSESGTKRRRIYREMNVLLSLDSRGFEIDLLCTKTKNLQYLYILKGTEA